MVKPFPKWFWWLNCPTQIIGLTSLIYIISSTGAKGSTQTNIKSKKGFKQKGAKPTEGCPSLAHRTVSGAPGRSTLNCSASGFWKCHSAIIHRTVRCSTGLSGVPSGATVTSETVEFNGRLTMLQCMDSSRRVRAGIRRRTEQWTVPVRCTTGLSGDPTCHSSNGRTLTVGDVAGAPDSVRWRTGLFGAPIDSSPSQRLFWWLGL
jgi:hypothetical protein